MINYCQSESTANVNHKFLYDEGAAGLQGIDPVPDEPHHRLNKDKLILDLDPFEQELQAEEKQFQQKDLITDPVTFEEESVKKEDPVNPSSDQDIKDIPESEADRLEIHAPIKDVTKHEPTRRVISETDHLVASVEGRSHRGLVIKRRRICKCTSWSS